MRVFRSGEWLRSSTVSLRLCELADCTDRYLGWLQDPEVNRYLETRWSEQSLESIRSFVASALASNHSYLFAIIANDIEQHVGNIKIGPFHRQHRHADVSYFVGERSAWGRGYATDAVRLVTEFGFDRLGAHRVQAGIYETNVGSRRVLEKCGYRLEARLEKHVVGRDAWEDYLWFRHFGAEITKL